MKEWQVGEHPVGNTRWVCVASGSPGTWVELEATLGLILERFVLNAEAFVEIDTRHGQRCLVLDGRLDVADDEAALIRAVLARR